MFWIRLAVLICCCFQMGTARARSGSVFSTCTNLKTSAEQRLELCTQLIDQAKGKAAKNPEELAKVFFARGVAYEQEYDYIRATADLSRAIDLDPHSAEYLFERGVLRFNQKYFEQAVSDYDRALDVNPKHGKARLNRAVANLYSGRYSGVLDDLNAVIAAEPRFELAYIVRARYYTIMGDQDKANADFDVAKVLDPDPQTIQRTQTTANWMRYLREIGEDDDYANWEDLPIRGYFKGK